MHIEDLNPAAIYQAETAAIYASVSGSVGSTVHDEPVDYSTGRRVPGPKTFTTVERVVSSRTSPASLWRIASATEGSVVGVVFVQHALPGRATSHALAQA